MRPDHTLTNEIRTVMENPTPIPELRRTVDAGRGHGRRECFDQSEAEREAHSACSVQRVLVDGHCRHSGRVTEEAGDE